MIHLALRRLWTRRLQALAPLVALLAATLGFQTVLVSARSTQAHVTGVIAANWNPPYDLLVRPASLVTGLRPGDHLIRPNYLDSVHGGISMEQVAAVRATMGVSVAAPAAVVATDYLWGQDYATDVSQLPHYGDLTAYRIATSFVTDAGLSQSTAVMSFAHLLVQGSGPPYIRMPDDNSSPEIAGRTVDCYYVWCYTTPSRYHPRHPEEYPYTAPWAGSRYPYDTELTAAVVAVDPAAEAALSGIDRCLSSGRNLSRSDAVVTGPAPGPSAPVRIPILMNSRPGYDDQIHATIEAASGAPLLPVIPQLPIAPRDQIPHLGGPLLETLDYHRVAEIRTDLNQAWNGVDGVGFTSGSFLYPTVNQSVDSLEPVGYSGHSPNLAAQTAPLGDVSGFEPYQPFNTDPPAEADTPPFHRLRQVPFAHVPYHAFDVVGKYDPACVSRGSPVASSALDIYANPNTTTPDGRVLGPNASMTNYVTPMPTLMTNLAGGAWFSSLDPARVAAGTDKAFISVVRVKVGGTSVPGLTSQRRLERVAAEIHARSGLAVDIIKGSSTQRMSIALPAGLNGRPAMIVHEDWLTENVAINFLNAINSTTLVMSIVVAVVAVLLTMQATYATVRRRRVELVLLRAVGWPSWRIALLMELEVVAVGAVVAVVALVVGGVLIVASHPGAPVAAGVLVAAPAAIVLTALAGAGPALTASRTRPLAVLRGPGKLRRRSRRQLRGPFGMGIREAVTTWRWQTILGALATAVGAMFLGAVLAIAHDFHASLDNTALAQRLAAEVGPFDILLGVLAVALGATTAVSVVLVATRERLPHFATLRALGWSRRQVGAVVAAQAMTVGVLGGVLGATALVILSARLHTGVGVSPASQLSPLALGVATGAVAAAAALRLVYTRVAASVLRVG